MLLGAIREQQLALSLPAAQQAIADQKEIFSAVIGQQRNQRKALGRKNRLHLFPGPESAVPDFPQGPKPDPEHPSCKYRHHPNLQGFAAQFCLRTLPKFAAHQLMGNDCC